MEERNDDDEGERDEGERRGERKREIEEEMNE